MAWRAQCMLWAVTVPRADTGGRLPVAGDTTRWGVVAGRAPERKKSICRARGLSGGLPTSSSNGSTVENGDV
jgi:hypothetical protein